MVEQSSSTQLRRLVRAVRADEVQDRAVRADEVANFVILFYTGQQESSLTLLIPGMKATFAVPSEWRQVDMMMKWTRTTATTMEKMPQVSPCSVYFHPRALVRCDPQLAL